jgi:hypothetical protein
VMEELALRSTVGVLNYLDDPQSSDPTRGLEFHVPNDQLTTMRLRGHEMAIRDARAAQECFTLDTSGFCLTQLPHRFSDPTDVREHNGSLLAETAEAVRILAGGTSAMCIGIQLRFAETSPKAGSGFNSLPARFVHGDFKGGAGLQLFARWPGFDPQAFSRLAVFNAWRVITPPPQDTPLAVCDARTASVDDSYDLTAVLEEQPQAPQRHDIAIYAHSPRHEWYYFSEMTPDELLVFKTFETDPARPYAVPHSAFDDSTFGSAAIPRGSAEARVLVAWD